MGPVFGIHFPFSNPVPIEEKHEVPEALKVDKLFRGVLSREVAMPWDKRRSRESWLRS